MSARQPAFWLRSSRMPDWCGVYFGTRPVPAALKTIPPATLLYLLFPVDFIPDLALGLGQLDDIAIILLGLKLFIELSPQEVVRRHLREMSSVSGSYRVVDDEEPPQEPPPSGYIEAPYHVVQEDEEG